MKTATVTTGFAHPKWEDAMAEIAALRNAIFYGEAKATFKTVVEQWTFAIFEVGKTTGKPKGKPIQVLDIPRTKRDVREAAKKYARKNKGAFVIVYIGTMHGMASPAQFLPGEYVPDAYQYTVPVWYQSAKP